MTAGVSNGERLYSLRYASRQVEANSLYVSNDARDVRQVCPEDERLQHLSDEARAVVSEPLADLPGLWREVPPSSAVIVQHGDDQEVPFTPHAPD
jgi:predicted glutamine amidotransferase